MNERSIHLRLIFALLLVALSLSAAYGQSGDPFNPSPVRTTNLLGKILARDLGDARLTDHYYIFTATPGDVIITVKGENLNGDVDVFTAGTLRPLLKFTLYAESNSPTTKTIYLRRREELVLRIEARTPNDDPGTYQVMFAGSFEPEFGAGDISEKETNAKEPVVSSIGAQPGRRVNSAGARIAEPESPQTEVAAAPTPGPTSEPVKPAPAESPAEKTGSPKTAATRTLKTRTRAPGSRPTATTRVITKKPKKAEAKPAETVEVESKPAEVPKIATKITKPRKSSRAAQPAAATPNSTANKAAEPPAESGPRLIIETSDGTLVNRYMSGVRRVTVEAGLIVLVGKDGKIQRVPLDKVLRFTIEP
ncbi:MAG: hypothetical protein ABR555_13515 [Pyrinomonadaceae bacterium]